MTMLGALKENTSLGVVEKVKQLREIGVSIDEKILPILNSEQQPKVQVIREQARRRIIEEIGSAVLQKLKDFAGTGDRGYGKRDGA
jgi:hypothetical protein